MVVVLRASDVERLENTSFASAFGAGPGAPGPEPTDAVICIQSVACEISNQCSNACVNTSIITVVTNTVGSLAGCQSSACQTVEGCPTLLDLCQTGTTGVY